MTELNVADSPRSHRSHVCAVSSIPPQGTQQEALTEANCVSVNTQSMGPDKAHTHFTERYFSCRLSALTFKWPLTLATATTITILERTKCFQTICIKLVIMNCSNATLKCWDIPVLCVQYWCVSKALPASNKWPTLRVFKRGFVFYPWCEISNKNQSIVFV